MRVRQTWRVAAALTATILGAGAVRAEGVPPAPVSLKDKTILACVQVDGEGKVSGAYLLSSTGDPGIDQDYLGWIRQLKWPKPSKGDKTVNAWLPMGFALGHARAPDAPRKCDPPATTPAG